MSGIPGVGKSTALRELKASGLLEAQIHLWDELKQFHVCYFLEPSDEWKEQGYLADFYSNPDAEAFRFQMKVYVSHNTGMVAILDKAIKDHPGKKIICISERSIWDQLLFWKQQVELGRKEALRCDDVYMENWHIWRRTLPSVSHIFLCMTKDMQTVMNRLKKRGERYEINLKESDDVAMNLNDGEETKVSLKESFASSVGDEEIKQVGGLTVEYQELLYARHREWFSSPVASLPIGNTTNESIPSTMLHVDMPYHNCPESLNNLATMIFDAMKPTLKAWLK